MKPMNIFHSQREWIWNDYHDNFYAGIHAANMAGTWQTIVNGFAGVRVNAGELELHPYVAGEVERNGSST